MKTIALCASISLVIAQIAMGAGAPVTGGNFPPELAPSKGGGAAPPNPGASLTPSTGASLDAPTSPQALRQLEVLEANKLGTIKSLISSTAAAPAGFHWHQHAQSCLDYDWGQVSKADRDRSTVLADLGRSHCKNLGKAFSGNVRCNGAMRKVEVMCSQ